jgi:gamma-glutamyltranspeptidase/glutathione hydrolase
MLALAFLLMMQAAPAANAQPVREQARSVVMTKHGIVAASQTLAAAAGAKVLEAGGNAVDAAIAANAVLGLVEPTGNGIGGDLFAIVYEARTGRVHGLNSSGWSPKALTPEFLEAQGHKRMPTLGIHSVTVPGAVAGWDALHRKFGRMKWSQLFVPAATYAEEGFPLTELIAGPRGWGAVSIIKSNPRAQEIYWPGGVAPTAGDIFRNPLLAKSLRLIAERGKDAYYKGPIAEAIVEASKEAGGTLTAADLAEFEPEWVEPVTTTYRGWQVYELPPNGQGIAALAMLNIMERFPLKEWGHNSAKTLHAMIEAKKLAYADMLRYVGDPRFSKIPIAEMASKDLAAKRAALIDPQRASCQVLPSELKKIAGAPGADTIYMSAVDAEGNIVSLIQSNYMGFGSGVVPPGTGFMLQNRGALFTLERNHANTLAPRKRPLHTIIPAFMQKDGVKIGFGIMGGWNQSQAHAQFVSNVVDHGFNVQWALEAARFTKETFEGCDVQVERRIPSAAVEELRKLGHDVRVTTPFSGTMGGGQAVMVNGSGVKFGGSDPRKDGAAVPQSPGFWARP